MEDIWYEKIDTYLSGEMNPEEKLLFEAELAANNELASKFNIYKNIEKTLRIRQSYKEELAAIKNILKEPPANDPFKSEEESAEPKTNVSRLKTIYKPVLSVAASILVIILGYYLFFNKSQNSQQLASNYIDQNISEIGQGLSSAQDSLQKGIAAYNQKDYENALRLFQNVADSNPANRDAKEYIGYVYLLKKDYEKALEEFDELDKMNGKFNKGLFLKAVTLLQRNKEGDLDKAIQLLQQVVNTKLGGSEEAEEWLQKLKDR